MLLWFPDYRGYYEAYATNPSLEIQISMVWRPCWCTITNEAHEKLHSGQTTERARDLAILVTLEAMEVNAPSIYKASVLENVYIVACPVKLLLFSVMTLSFSSKQTEKAIF